MKQLITFSLIISFVFTQSISIAQNVSAAEYEDLINDIIYEFTDFGLKNQKNQPHYAAFKRDVELRTYVKVMEFLKPKTNLPKNIREIVNIIYIDYFKERYNDSATNQEKYDVLMGLFEEEELKAFAANYSSTYPNFETDLQGTIREQLRVVEYNDDVLPEEVIEAAKEEFEEIASPPEREQPAENPNDFSTDDKSEVEKSNELGNSLLLFGFLLLLLAYGGYLLYQRRKTTANTNQKSTPITTRPTTPVVPVSNRQKGLWGKVVGRPSKKEVYYDSINDLQLLIQNHKKTLALVRADIETMHQKVNQLSALADKEEEVEEHLKDLSEKLDEVEAKQKELLIILDDIENMPEPENNDEETVNLKIEEPKTVKEIVDEIPIVPTTIKLTAPPDLFFMPAPNADGSFNYDEWSPKFTTDKSFYRFEMLNNVEAKFVFYNDKENIARAIENPEVYLNPACKILNIDFKNPTTIVIQKQNSGIVYKDGNQWRLKEKAVVYYQ